MQLATSLKELYDYRALIWLLVKREIKARYKQTSLGIAWAAIQPLLMMGVLTIVFSTYLNVSSGGSPYPIFSFVALVPWLFITKTVTNASMSYFTYRGIVTKVYFPREIIALVSVLSAFIDFLISVMVLILLMVVFQFWPTWHIVYILLLLPIQILFALSIAMFFSFFAALYRDVEFILPFFIQVWMYASPVIYGLQGMKSSLIPFFYINPVTGIIEGYRRVLVFHQAPQFQLLAISAIFSLLLFIVSYWLFKRLEGFIIDIL